MKKRDVAGGGLGACFPKFFLLQMNVLTPRAALSACVSSFLLTSCQLVMEPSLKKTVPGDPVRLTTGSFFTSKMADHDSFIHSTTLQQLIWRPTDKQYALSYQKNVIGNVRHGFSSGSCSAIIKCTCSINYKAHK